METAQETTFQRRIREKREAEARALAEAKAAHPSFDNDLIPTEQHQRSEEDQEMDRIIKGIDILDAYAKWCGKMKPKVSPGQTENIMVSCPMPGHADKKPSAAINTDKQVWACYGTCDTGGDAIDLAAIYYGMTDYKEGAKFHELRRKMAQDFGYIIKRTVGGQTIITEPLPEAEPTAEEPSNIVELFEEEYDDDINFEVSLDWKSIVPEQTFLRTYMDATCPDDVPEEYHFWNGLLAIGFAIGRDVRLYDRVPVYGNLYICTLGRSGSGKSRAQGHFENLMNAALPYKDDDDNSKGMKKISSAASGEALTRAFMKPQMDPANPKIVKQYLPVRGLIEYSELSALVGRTQRQGNVSIPTLQDFYDMKSRVSTESIAGGVKVAELPYASALTTTQPKSLRGLLTQDNAASGFINRWVFAPGTEKPRVAIGGTLIDVTPAVKPLQDIQGWAASWMPAELMMWTPEADARFTEFFHERIYKDQKKDNGDMLTRVDLLLKKLILLFTANRMERVVPLESVEEAIACYPYLLASYNVTESQVSLTVKGDIVNKVLYQAKRFTAKKQGITMNELTKALKGSKIPPDILVQVVKSLIATEQLEELPTHTGKPGRPAHMRFKYVG